MKWSVDFLSISRNGQLDCPFHEMDNFLVHFTKWTISHLGHNIYTIIFLELGQSLLRHQCLSGCLHQFWHFINASHLLALVDKFIWFDIAVPGSSSNSQIFLYSDPSSKMADNTIGFPQAESLLGYFIIGDDAFPSEPG